MFNKLYAELRRDLEKMLDDALDDILGGTWPTAHAMARDQHVASTTFSPRRAVRSRAYQLPADSVRRSPASDRKEGYTVVGCAGGAPGAAADDANHGGVALLAECARHCVGARAL